MPDRGATEDRSMFSVFAAFMSVLAFMAAALCIVIVSTKDSGTSSTSVSAGPATVPVTLSEFKITPASLSAPAGQVKINVTNGGSQTHNLQVTQLNKKTADIPAGKSAVLDLGDVKAGTYDVICTVPGHADSGMKATLTVTEGGSTSASASPAVASSSSSSSAGMDMSGMSSAADYAAMDKRMQEGMAAGLKAFATPAAATAKTGNQKLQPTVAADGTKEFQLEASIVDWEVQKGKTVKAWAYNGMVPGPWIRVEPGDHVRITLKNNLPMSTDIHWHGIDTPFNQDGVSPLTQPPIEPGQSFTYEFTLPATPELGMYHAHMNGQVSVPNGMFAVFQSGDLPLPRGQTVNGINIPANMQVSQELPIVLNDAGTIGLSLNGKAYPSTDPIVANVGDWVVVHYYNEGLLTHPMHLHHVPTLVVAKDGWPLESPYWADTINVAPGERYSVLMHVTADDIGIWAWHCHILNHAENDDGLFGMVTALVVPDPNKPKQ